MLNRLIKKDVERALREYPAVALSGPRQVGKTTLAKQIVDGRSDLIMLDLERPSDLNKLNDAETFLSFHKDKLICIDEVQLRPDLFPLLRALIDDDRKRNGRFLILGSSSPELLRQSSETLAGRISYIFITPFNQIELADQDDYSWTKFLTRGGYPDSYLAPSDEASFRWRENYVQTFLERDLRQFGIDRSPQQMRRLWAMIAHIHGQSVNYSKLGQSLDLTHPTIKAHIDIFVSTFMMRSLPPFEVNTKKRLVKSPKLYVKDCGILNYLLNLRDFDTLYSHPSYGSCWEGFAIENILSILNPNSLVGFYRSHEGEEIDLVFEWQGKKIGLEFKTSSSPKLVPGNYQAMNTLGLEKLYVITPDADTYPLKGDKVVVMSLKNFLQETYGGKSS